MSAAAKQIRDVAVEANVVIEINDQDVVERITGPGGDEWRSSFYDLHTENDVLQHLAFNCVANGAECVRQLDGWADLPDDAATMNVVRETFGADVWPAPSVPGEEVSGGA